MFAILHALGMFIADLFKSRCQLEAENLFLRHQLNVTLRRAPPRHCEAVTAAAEKLGDAMTWFDTQTLVADGMSIMGQRQEDPERLREESA